MNDDFRRDRLRSALDEHTPDRTVMLNRIAANRAGATRPRGRIVRLAGSALAVVTVLGISFLLAAINVRYRDIGHLVPFLLQLLLFASPVLYASDVVPAHWRALYGVNPAAGLLDMVRWCLFGTPVELPTLAMSLASAVLLLAAGVAYFTRAERKFPDYI